MTAFYPKAMAIFPKQPFKAEGITMDDESISLSSMPAPAPLDILYSHLDIDLAILRTGMHSHSFLTDQTFDFSFLPLLRSWHSRGDTSLLDEEAITSTVSRYRQGGRSESRGDPKQEPIPHFAV